MVRENTQFKKGMIPWNKGKKGILFPNRKSPIQFSEIHRKRMSDAHKKIGTPWMVGRTGKNHPKWKGGISTDSSHYTRQRRNRKFNASGSHTKEQWEMLKAQYNFICAWCKKSEPEIKLTEDHIRPLSKGGSDYIENIQPLCGNCNSRKHTKIIVFDIIKRNYSLI